LEHLDVIVVGAGLSGIGAAVRLTTMCPARTFAVLEGRRSMGGTWDLFRYPGVRSDSDMFTLSYPFRPWVGERAIADGGSILDYLRSTAEDLAWTGESATTIGSPGLSGRRSPVAGPSKR
jgi:monooxygenase